MASSFCEIGQYHLRKWLLEHTDTADEGDAARPPRVAAARRRGRRAGARAGPGAPARARCGVCRTDLHLRDGEVAAGHLPLILGHQIVATTDDGRRVGVPWLGWTDGECAYCRSGRENLCVARAVHRQGHRRRLRRVRGGRRALHLRPAREHERPRGGAAAVRRADRLPRAAARRRRRAARTLRLRGGSAHIICQVAVHQGRRVFAFTRAQDSAAQELARSLGAEWAGDAMAPGPEPLDAAIMFAPAGPLVPAALRATAPGGVVVCAGIHMSDIPSFPTASSGRSASCDRSPTSRATTRASSWSWRRACPSARPSRSTRWRRPRRRPDACGPGECAAPAGAGLVRGLGGAQRRASVSWLSVAPWPVIFAAPQRAASFTASSTVSQAARP